MFPWGRFSRKNGFGPLKWPGLTYMWYEIRQSRFSWISCTSCLPAHGTVSVNIAVIMPLWGRYQHLFCKMSGLCVVKNANPCSGGSMVPHDSLCVSIVLTLPALLDLQVAGFRDLQACMCANLFISGCYLLGGISSLHHAPVCHTSPYMSPTMGCPQACMPA